MSTPATTRVVSGGKVHAILYRAFDGGPAEHGRELYRRLALFSCTDGFGVKRPLLAFDGAGCLAASLVACFKKRRGLFYLLPDAPPPQGWDYLVVTEPEDPLRVTVSKDGEARFSGTVREFGKWLRVREK